MSQTLIPPRRLPRRLYTTIEELTLHHIWPASKFHVLDVLAHVLLPYHLKKMNYEQWCKKRGVVGVNGILVFC